MFRTLSQHSISVIKNFERIGQSEKNTRDLRKQIVYSRKERIGMLSDWKCMLFDEVIVTHKVGFYSSWNNIASITFDGKTQFSVGDKSLWK